MEMRIRKSGLFVLGMAAFTTFAVAAAPRFSDWSAPQNLGPTVNSTSSDIAPAISKDGLSLYFASNRPAPPGVGGGFDIWVSQRASVDSEWGTPQNLGPLINTAALESVPSLSRDGHWLFFNSDRAGGSGGVDIWASFRFDKHDDFAWQAPFNLGPGVNSTSFDGGPFLFDNEDAGAPLLFFGSNRPSGRPGTGAIDVYVSERTPDGSFGPATLIAELSTPQNDQRAMVRFDGLELFLFSDRDGGFGLSDIWVSTRPTVADPWSTPVNLGPTINTTFNDSQPYLTSHRETLFFTSNRPASPGCPVGCGAFDLYVTTRHKLKGPSSSD